MRSLGDFRFEREEGGRVADPYAMLLPCRHGHIYLHGPRTLGAATRRRGAIARRLAALPGVQVVQDGADGINAVFDWSDFDAVAAVMLPRRRRRLSLEHRAKLAESNRQFRFASNRDFEEPGQRDTGGFDSDAA